MLETATPYTPSNTSVVPAPTEVPEGLNWILWPMKTAAGPAEIEWLQSVYHEVPLVRNCQATAVYDPVGKPPLAMQLTRLDRPSLSAKGAASTASPTPEVVHHRPEQRSSVVAMVGSYLVTIPATPTSPASLGKSVDADQGKSYASPRSSLGSALLNTRSKVAQSTSTTEYPSIATLRRITSAISTTPTYDISEPGDSTWTTVLDHSGSAASYLFGVSGLLMKSGNVLFHNHTIAFTSAQTFGSGSIVTRFALTTDSKGHTFLLGDSITLSSQTVDRKGQKQSSWTASITIPPSSAAFSTNAWPTSSSMPTTASTGLAIKVDIRLVCTICVCTFILCMALY